jgi:hypothetical protein
MHREAIHAALLAAFLVLPGCSSSSSPAPASPAADAGDTDSGGGDTWDSWAQGFFTKYCVECHSASDPQMRDYTKKADVARDFATIRCGVASAQDAAWACAVAPRQFPIDDAAKTNPKPSDAERARAVAWINAGLP